MPRRHPKRKRLWLADGPCVRLRQEHRDHVCSYDLRVRMDVGRPLRLLTALDEYHREYPAIEVSRKLSSEDVLRVPGRPFVTRGIPSYIRSDNGPEFTTVAVPEWLERVGVQTLFIEPGSPGENGYNKSFNEKFQDELLNGEIFTSLWGGRGC